MFGNMSSLEEEVPLKGGAIAEVVRVGDTVRRSTGPSTPEVHALLRHLEAVECDPAPRVLGTDERGRAHRGSAHDVSVSPRARSSTTGSRSNGKGRAGSYSAMTIGSRRTVRAYERTPSLASMTASSDLTKWLGELNYRRNQVFGDVAVRRWVHVVTS